MDLKGIIRSRSQSEWKTFFLDHLTNFRIFAQENGEKALLLGFAIGIFIVLFFKIFVFLFCLAALAFLVIMVIAEPVGSGGESAEPPISTTVTTEPSAQDSIERES